MTTKVHIVNLGPEPVRIHVCDREDGRFEAGEKETLHPGNSTDVYVHKHQNAAIFEETP